LEEKHRGIGYINLFLTIRGVMNALVINIQVAKEEGQNASVFYLIVIR